MNAKRLIPLALTVLACGYYGLFLSHPLQLVTADLGRHIKNGELFFSLGKPLTANYYSYPYPDFPVVNHHWGSGALFFMIWDIAGFPGVHIFFIAISLCALLLFFHLAQRQGGILVAALLSLLIVPLLSERSEVRPEAFSYLFAGIFLLILWKHQAGALRARALLLLPLLEVLWVNTHIYFFLGPVIIGCFALEAATLAPLMRSGQFKRLFWCMIATAAATFINPFGAQAVLQPFTILQHYGYRLAENQPVWVIEKLIYNPHYLLFKIVFGILAASVLLVMVKKGREIPVATTLLAIMVSIMGWLQIRNFALFGFFALPLIAINIGLVFPSWKTKMRGAQACAAGALLLTAFLMIRGGSGARIFPALGKFGIGLEKGNSRAAAFFVAHGIQGPIFNNYDMGGYLIYYLFPREKVFVDNRPEAYPVSFFNEVYIPMQEEEKAWERESARFGFNAIVFSYHDATPWGQHFIIERTHDPAWAPVYVDQNVLILLKRNEHNKSLIQRYEIPQEYFQVVPTGV